VPLTFTTVGVDAMAAGLDVIFALSTVNVPKLEAESGKSMFWAPAVTDVPPFCVAWPIVTKAPTVVNVHVVAAVVSTPELDTAPAAMLTVTVLEFVRPLTGTRRFDPEIDGVPIVQFVPVIKDAFAIA